MLRSPSRHLFRVPGLLFLLLFFTLSGPWPATAGGNRPATGSRLVVSEFGSGKVIVSLPAASGERFTIRYIHSVDKTPIFEEFRLDAAKGIILEKTWFTMFGAGLGHWPGHGRLTQDKNWITIRDINRPLGSFILRIGALSVGHTIIFRGRQINLSRRAAGVRALVEFRLE